MPILSVSCSIGAEEVYKTIDENGTVLYSSVPPKKNVKVKVIQAAPAPSPEMIEAAQFRLLELQALQEVDREASKRDQPKRKQSQSFSRKTISKLPPRYKSLIRSQ